MNRRPEDRDLYIDGVAYRVPFAVYAHVKFQSDLLSNLAQQAAAYARRIVELNGRQTEDGQ